MGIEFLNNLDILDDAEDVAVGACAVRAPRNVADNITGLSLRPIPGPLDLSS